MAIAMRLKKARRKMNWFLRDSFSSSLLLKYLKKRCLTAFFFLISEKRRASKIVIFEGALFQSINLKRSFSNENKKGFSRKQRGNRNQDL